MCRGKKDFDIPCLVQLKPRMYKHKCYKIFLSSLDENADFIEVLLGVEVAGKLITGQREKLKTGLVALETKLGWTLMDGSARNKLWPDLEGEKDFNDDHREENTDFVQSIAGFQECDEEDVETWMACDV
ncbi:uncharacterized protein TNCV_3596881 [Trichonephila clavipes]|nr:uncharacterized protein TNCV_3596881 [Trichonephila clavipes]